MRRFFFSCICLFTCLQALVAGQRDSLSTVYGRVADARYGEKANLGVRGATIQLVPSHAEKPDTLFRTIVDGNFRFDGIPSGDIFLKIFCQGMETISGNFEIIPGKNTFLFYMEPKSIDLEGAVVKGKIPIVTHTKDTTKYNILAVNVLEDDRLRSALEQLPGFEISDGGIKVDGEEIKRTYVNGVLIFGSNVVTAVNTLNASEVSEVKVFSEQNAEDKRRGLKQSRKEKVLDITTKESLLILSEALAYASVGVDDTGQPRYAGVGTAAYYSESLQVGGGIAVDNNSSRLGQLQIGLNPSNALMLSREHNGSLTEYEESNVADLYVEKHWKDRSYGNILKANYKHIHQYDRLSEISLSDHFDINGHPSYILSDTTNSYNTASSHKIIVTLEMLDTKLKSIYWNTTALITQRNNCLGSNLYKRFDDKTLRSNQADETFDKDYSLYSNLIWRNNDLKSLRPSLSFGASAYRKDNPSHLTDTLSSSWQPRRLITTAIKKHQSIVGEAGLEWVLINKETNTLSLWGRLSSSLENTTEERQAMDYFPIIPIVYEADTYNFNWKTFSGSISLGGTYNTSVLNLNASIMLVNTVLSDQESYPAPESLSRQYCFVLPSFSLKYKNLTIDASLKENLPEIMQLRNRVYDSNPMMVLKGNPELKAFYSSEISIRWGRTFKTYSLGLSLDNKVTCGKIVQNQMLLNTDTPLFDWSGYVAKAGSSLFSYINSSRPEHITSISASLSKMLFKRKVSATFKVAESFSGAPTYISNQPVSLYTNSVSAEPSIVITPNNKMKFNVRAGMAYLRSFSESGQFSMDRITWNALASARIKVLPKLTISGRYSFSGNTYISQDGLDQYRHTLGASISWTIIKNILVISLDANDLLNGGSIYRTTLTSEAFTQIWTPTYGRYFMLSAKYSFRKK